MGYSTDLIAKAKEEKLFLRYGGYSQLDDSQDAQEIVFPLWGLFHDQAIQIH